MASWAIAVRWRKWMTNKVMGRYFGRENFFHLLDNPSLDNPGMRICDDIEGFTKHFIFLSDRLLLMTLRVFSFSYVLWQISKALVFTCWIYSIIGTLVLLLYFGKKLSATNKEFIKDTANFRAGLLRVRENAESVAFYHAADQELKWAGGRFFDLVHGLWYISFYESWLESMRCFMNWTAEFLPYFVLVRCYFLGEIEHGHISQACWAFESLLNGFTQLVRDLPRAAQLNAKSK